MHIHADRTQRVRVESGTLPWSLSPSGGVERRMLERDGGEVARATTVVRFAPGSSFPEHGHGGGEEFLVLEGVFSDEEGDFPAGWYVRNPPGSRHSPRSEPGCTLLVKLRQMADDDREKVRIDTRRAEASAVADGVGQVRLFSSAAERVAMFVLEPGARWTFAPEGVELFVVEGVAEVDGETCPSGTWSRIPEGQAVAVTSATGARIFAKTGHLTSPTARSTA